MIRLDTPQDLLAYAKKWFAAQGLACSIPKKKTVKFTKEFSKSKNVPLSVCQLIELCRHTVQFDRRTKILEALSRKLLQCTVDDIGLLEVVCQDIEWEGFPDTQDGLTIHALLMSAATRLEIEYDRQHQFIDGYDYARAQKVRNSYFYYVEFLVVAGFRRFVHPTTPRSAWVVTA
jgi:hypothetical protein